jgi:phosphoglycolate phosphatase
MPRLVLFDVDGTLIKRGDPDHLAAMDHAVHTVFPESRGASVTQIDFDGKVDRVIASEVLGVAGMNIKPDDPRLDRAFTLAGEYYRGQWEHRQGGTDDLLPGVIELLEHLQTSAGDYALGVLTGGSSGIVSVKMDRLGLSDAFPIGSFGNEVPNRPALVPLAIERAEAYFETSFGPDATVIIGDTPHDVDCAHAHDIPCIGVATGKYGIDELREAGAEVVLSTLEGAESVTGHINELTAR